MFCDQYYNSYDLHPKYNIVTIERISCHVLFQPIENKTKTNHDILARVFLLFLALATNNCSKFSLANFIDCVCCDWPSNNYITLVLVSCYSIENRSMTTLHACTITTR